MKPLIKVEGASKKFCRDLKRSLRYGVHDLAREFTGRGRKQDLRKDEFWAVRDVSFEVKRGEILGMIGSNGSGKTTMLRLLNGLIKPDGGQITMRGRVGALIQLGAGFSPILSGRENIKINAAVLGIPTAEVNRKINEIIEYSEIGEFIDAPVRTYSSGMRARLGFAVAVNMKPDILLVDEVLAVGDLNFRLKALDTMSNLTNSGCAVVFVTHNLAYIERICDSAIHLNKGTLEGFGSVQQVVQRYSRGQSRSDSLFTHSAGSLNFIEVTDVKFMGPNGSEAANIESEQPATIRISFEAMQDLGTPHFTLHIQPTNNLVNLARIQQSMSPDQRQTYKKGIHTLDIKIPKMMLLRGQYRASLSVLNEDMQICIVKVTNLPLFDVHPAPHHPPNNVATGVISADWDYVQ